MNHHVRLAAALFPGARAGGGARGRSAGVGVTEAPSIVYRVLSLVASCCRMMLVHYDAGRVSFTASRPEHFEAVLQRHGAERHATPRPDEGGP